MMRRSRTARLAPCAPSSAAALGAALLLVGLAGCGTDDDSANFNGSNGSNGSNGYDFGANGSNGSNGTNGANGSSGAPGPSTGVGAEPFPGETPADQAVDDDSIAPDEETGVLVQPFVRTAHDPFSTFAADVDSASYDLFIKSVQQRNALPPATQIRSEEFVNFFRYDYPAVPDDAMDPFVIDLDLGPTPAASTVLLRVGVQGEDRLDERTGSNLVFLIDVSGSMGAGDKLPLVQRMLVNALDVLDADDLVSIVTYSGRTSVALTPTPVSEAGTIRAAIEGLRAGGSTAGGDGLQLAYDQAEAGFIDGGINHIILCTDGDFNIGPHTNEELVQIVEDRRGDGVTFTALGFGLGNLNDSMMEAISNAGNGIYRVISGDITAQRYVETRLLSDVMHIAKDVKLQVEFNPDLVYAYRQIGYENRQLDDDDFRDDTVDAGEIGSGHQMTALYELALTEAALPLVEGAPAVEDGDPIEGDREILAGELVMVKLRYKAPGATEEDPATEIRQSFSGDVATATLSPESEFAWAAATVAAQLRNDPYHDVPRLDAAQVILEAHAATADWDRVMLQSVFQTAIGLSN